ncbi:uracil-DNA glycosylase [Sphingomonas crocodyli]|uniref:Type-5 uracil-DNA glycosylase n=1 Tax=Sphingomonas crocodyli TaxID=1979270 RepID=A0A437LZB1_9SPHN|nr:uracil-DNA glycosylase [Sphingomonas crocodyli]RVT90769.1 uracil-DNA glycosylase [Sphingomonas crocodyli]
MTALLEPAVEPDRDCPLCPRLVDLRETLRAQHPDWHNAPVGSFGDPDAWLAIVGLAPGMHGANRTGRPFTGDQSGPLFYDTLLKLGLAKGDYGATPDDGLAFDGVIIINAVRCLPPANKPTPEEVRTCRQFLEPALDALPNLKVVVALGQIAHQSAVKALGGKLPKCRFAHGAEHRVPRGTMLIDSYHPSRYNQNTGRITAEMFEGVFARAIELHNSSSLRA